MNRTRLLFPVLGVGIAAVVATVIVTTSSSAKATQPTPAGGSAISIEQTSLGNTLVDANGRTLYLFEADRPNVSTLSDAGQAIGRHSPPARSPRQRAAQSPLGSARSPDRAKTTR